jgi:UDP-N-acetylmuramyl pentapeptide phosphotransferase/UDP-N-acetylglucosamine-1-phosphate transferase
MSNFDFILLKILIIIFISFCVSYIFNKKKILIDNKSYSKHKKIIKNSLISPPLCGGIILYICSLFLFRDFLVINIYGLFILLIGIFSDINKLNSPKIRIFLQFIVCYLLTLIIDIQINDLRVYEINILLENKIGSVLFTILCILILINGTNFLDGLNTLVIGYYMIICVFLLILSKKFNLNLDENIVYLILILLILYYFNFFEKIYLGDAGSYLVAFYISIFAIDFVNKNISVSPYFVCLLLWYPAFENLFSILRRFFVKKKIEKADKHHLHHLIYLFLLKKKFTSKININTFSANLINFYNLIIFYFFYEFYSQTKIIIIAIVFNLLIYLIIYFYIKKKMKLI